MSKYNWGRKRFEIKDGFPRLFLHEKHEKIVKRLMRLLTLVGITLSVFSFQWYTALAISIFLVILDWFLERTLFYYSSMYVTDMVLDYDPKQWVATVVVSIGEPDDPRSLKIIGILLKDHEYAKKLFSVLHNWAGTEDNTQGDLRLTFIIDEDMYYVYLYKNLKSKSFNRFTEKVKQSNLLKKYGKEHFPLIMQQTLCKGFETTKGFALGMFLDNNPPGKEFILAPYITSPTGSPIAADEIEPIYMSNYKSKIPSELNKDDFEYYHWHKLVKRTGVKWGKRVKRIKGTLPNGTYLSFLG